jgi:glycosyltransferase involved in cell wall biosynthesis
MVLASTGANGGITKALNLGLAKCQAPLVARQDADDWSAPTRLEVQLQHLRSNPHLSLVGSDMFTVDAEGRVLGLYEKPRGQNLHDMMPVGCPLVHGSVVFVKSHVMMLGGYDPNGEYPYAEDYHLWARMHLAGLRMDNVCRPLYFHRNHPTKSSMVYQAKQADSTRRIIQMVKAGGLR